MNTKGKIAIALTVMMVAAAMTVPMVMGDNVEYSATVSSQQNTALISSNGAFGDVSAGSINDIDPTIQLQNTGNTNATVEASGADFSDGGTNSFAITNLKINGVAVTTTGAEVVSSVPADSAIHDYAGELSIPTGQAGGIYTTNVTLVFQNAAGPA